MAKTWNSVSRVTDAGRGAEYIKEYHVIIINGDTQAAIASTPSYFNKGDFRGIGIGDRLKVETEASTVTYVVTDELADQGLDIDPVPGTGSADAATASEVLYTSPASGPTSAAVEVQTALDLLNGVADTPNTLVYAPATGVLTYDDVAASPVSIVLTASTIPASGAAGSGPLQAATGLIQNSLNLLNTEAADVRSLLGHAVGETNHGSFTGSTIPDGQTTKAALQALETAVEAAGGSSTDDQTAAEVPYPGAPTGPAAGTADVDAALDALSTMAGIYDPRQDDLQTLTGRPATSANMGAMSSGSVLSDNATIRALLLEIDAALTGTPAGETNFVAPSQVNGIGMSSGGANGHAPTMNINLATLASAIAAQFTAADISTIWGKIVGTHMVWNGTKLDIDYNNNSNATA